MATTYRFVETTPSGTLTIANAEAAVHIILRGTATGFTVAFDDATTFSDRKLFRITNDSTQTVAIANHTGSITDTLLAGNVLQATLTSTATEAGVWNFAQHVTGAYAAAGQMNTDADLIQYARLAGRSGGQTLIGGTASGDDLTLSSTSHGTKGTIIFGTSGYDEVNNRLGIKTAAPLTPLHIQSGTAVGAYQVGTGVLIESAESSGCSLDFVSGNTAAQSIYFNDKSGNAGLIQYDHNTDWLTVAATAVASIKTNGYARLNVDADGNVGVGTYTFGTNAAKVLGIYNGTAPTTQPANTVQLWAADDIMEGASALWLRTEGARNYLFSERLGIGTTSPSAVVDIEKAGGAKATTDFIELTNTGQAHDMDGTGTAILFRQSYHDDSTPTVVDCAKIVALTENDWTSTTYDSAIAFYTQGSRVFAERMRITGGGSLLIGGTTEDNTAAGVLQLFSNTAPGAHVDGSVQIFSVPVTGTNEATLGIYSENAVEALGAGLTISQKYKMSINGTEYWVGLDPV